MEYTREQLQVWLKAELKDLVADRKHIDESDMPLFNKGLDWVCALETKVDKILNKLAAPDLYEALKDVTEGLCDACKHTVELAESEGLRAYPCKEDCEIILKAKQAIAKAEGK